MLTDYTDPATTPPPNNFRVGNYTYAMWPQTDLGFDTAEGVQFQKPMKMEIYYAVDGVWPGQGHPLPQVRPLPLSRVNTPALPVPPSHCSGGASPPSQKAEQTEVTEGDPGSPQASGGGGSGCGPASLLYTKPALRLWPRRMWIRLGPGGGGAGRGFVGIGPGTDFVGARVPEGVCGTLASERIECGAMWRSTGLWSGG